MTYKEYKPCDELKVFIKCFLDNGKGLSQERESAIT